MMPTFGIILFIILYIIAAMLYPGGSQADINSVGFSWINNYWCNLLNEIAINGKPNPAKPVALAGMLVLCITLSWFWYVLPKYINLKKNSRLMIQVPGIISMITSLFLFTRFHDIVIDAAVLLGFIPLTGTFIILYKLKWYKLFIYGILNTLLVGLNNYVYYTKGLIIYLPVIQKISFGFFLLWICSVNISLYKEVKQIDF